MKKKYINIFLAIPEEDYEMAYAALMDLPFCGIEEKLDELILTFELDNWNDSLRDEMLALLSDVNPEIEIRNEEIFGDKNWNEEWEKSVDPIIVSEKIAITPEWHAKEMDNEIKIIINPKMSFGTGHHATTRLCGRIMDRIVVPGSSWIDAGTGTGVLAILAVRLGAKYCYAFDNNEWSIDNAKENVELNGVADKIDVEQADIDLIELPETDAIAANLFIHLVNSALPKFYKALEKRHGDLVVSGILKYDREIVENNADKAGFRLVSSMVEDEWVAFHFKADKK